MEYERLRYRLLYEVFSTECTFYDLQQATGINRFSQAGDSAELQGLLFGFIGNIACDKDNRYVTGCRVVLQPATDLMTIHLRHHDIQQYEIRGRRLFSNFESLFPAGGRLNLVCFL